MRKLVGGAAGRQIRQRILIHNSRSPSFRRKCSPDNNGSILEYLTRTFVVAGLIFTYLETFGSDSHNSQLRIQGTPSRAIIASHMYSYFVWVDSFKCVQEMEFIFLTAVRSKEVPAEDLVSRTSGDGSTEYVISRIIRSAADIEKPIFPGIS